MVVGLPEKGVAFDALDIARGTCKVRGDSTGIPQRMPREVDFTAKNGIRPDIDIYHSPDDVPGMIDKMKAGKTTKKMVASLA